MTTITCKEAIVARHSKRTVDYFPHMVKHSTTMDILESRWGNDGYAFWFKILELLGMSDGHFYDASNPARWYALVARVKLDDETAREILDLLASIEAIDKSLWEGREIIWCDNFVDGVADAYRKRKVELPTKPHPDGAKPTAGAEPNEPKEDLSGYEELFEKFWAEYPNPKGRKPALEKWLKLKPDATLYAEIMAGLRRHKKTDQWKENNGRYIPMATTFLNQERFRDKVEARKEKAWNEW